MELESFGAAKPILADGRSDALPAEKLMFEKVSDCGGPDFDHARFDHRRCPGCQGWLDLHHIGCPIAGCREAITREEADKRMGKVTHDDAGADHD